MKFQLVMLHPSPKGDGDGEDPVDPLSDDQDGDETLTAARMAFGIVCIMVCTSTRDESAASSRLSASSGVPDLHEV